MIGATKKGLAKKAGKKLKDKATKKILNSLISKAAGLIPGIGTIIAMLPPELRNKVLAGIAVGAGALIGAALKFLIGQLQTIGGIIGGVIGGGVGFVLSGGNILVAAGGAGVGATIGNQLAGGINFGLGGSGGAAGFEYAATSGVTQAFITGTLVVGGGAMVTQTIMSGAFLAPFPTYDPRSGEVSKYVIIKKVAQETLENGSSKFEEPQTLNYSIEITPRDQYVLEINSITDVFNIRYNTEQRIEDGIGEADGSGPADPPPFESEINSFAPTTLNPGETLTFNYTVDFTDEYQHSRIVNKITLNFAVEDEGEIKNETALGAESVIFGEYGGDLCWPTTGFITQEPYSEDYCSYSGSSHCGRGPGVSSDYHPDAYDIGTPVGTPVYAAEGGTVIIGSDNQPMDGNHPTLSSDFGLGYYIKIEGIYTSVYAHLSDIMVESEEVVEQGDPIGLTGDTGNSTGPHLHWEIKEQTSGEGWEYSYILRELFEAVEGTPVSSDTCL
jgi:murein DD-endopeptidase MepM/ murein hydrolase activator NlpD